MVIGVLLSVIGFGCIKKPLDPVMPESDIQASIPIINRTRTVADLYSKPSSGVTYDSTLQTFTYKSYKSFSPLGIDTLKTAPHDQSSTVALGQIVLPGFPATNQNLDVSSALGQALPFNYPGEQPPLVPQFPAKSVALPGVSLPPNSSFDWLAVDTGSVTLTVTNTLPLQVQFSQPIVLKNNSINPFDTTTIASFNIGTLDSAGTPGSTVSLTEPLQNVIIYSDLKSDSIRFNTVARSTSFTVFSGEGLAFTFSSGDFVVDSASAVIPNQVIVPKTDSLFTVDDSIVVQQADFRGGSFNAVIENHSNVTVAMYLRFDDLLNNQNNTPYLINSDLSPHSTSSFPIDLTQYRIQTTPSTLGTKISFRLGINSIQSTSKVPITSRDYISAGIQVTSPFIIKDVTGKIKPTTLVVNSGAGGLLGSLPENFTADSVNFSQQSLTLDLGIYSGFVMDYNLTLKGISRKSNKVITLTVPPPVGQTANRITPTPGKLTQLVLDNSTGFTSFLNSFFPSLPDTFVLSGTVTLNPPDVFASAGGYETIHDTSKLYSSVGILFPMKMGISNATYTDVMSIKGTFDSSFVADVKSGALYFSIDNGLPLSFGFLASFQGYDTLTHARQTLLTVPLDGTPQTINGGTVNTTTGQVTSARSTNFSISLVTEQIQQLVAADSVALVFYMSTSNAPTPIVLSPDDEIHVRASASMVYRLKGKNQ